MQRFVRYGIAVVAVAVAVGLSACGQGKASEALPVVTGARAAKLIAASADKAQDVGTARMRGGVTVDLEGQRKTVTMDGVLDYRTGAIQFGMDMSDLGLPGGSDMTIEMRVVDGVSYMRFGDMPGPVGQELDARTGGRWIRVDPAAMGLGATGGTGFDQGSPGSTVSALRGVDDVERVGTEDVDGVATVHYRGVIDVAKATAELPEELRSQLDDLGGLFSNDWPVDVWVDAEGQTRKMSMRVEAPMMTLSTEFEFYDFGTDVDLAAPAPEDTVDFQEVFGSLGAGTPSV